MSKGISEFAAVAITEDKFVSWPRVAAVAAMVAFSLPTFITGLEVSQGLSPMNAVWALIWRTRLGYEIRAFGYSESAAKYAGISPTKIIMISMIISGALAGMMAINNVMGEAERLVLNAVEGAGFIGIAVALMGRSHPLGVFVAALLFGFLYQGGAEMALSTGIPRELIIVIQALVILFTGALDNVVRMPLERMFLSMRRKNKQMAAE